MIKKVSLSLRKTRHIDKNQYMYLLLSFEWLLKYEPYFKVQTVWNILNDFPKEIFSSLNNLLYWSFNSIWWWLLSVEMRFKNSKKYSANQK